MLTGRWKASDGSAQVGTGARGSGGSRLRNQRTAHSLLGTQLIGTHWDCCERIITNPSGSHGAA